MHIVRRCLFVLTMLICLGFTYRNFTAGSIELNGLPYVVGVFVDTYYEPLSDNVGLTTINGISNVYYNMKIEGYEVYKETITNKSIDVSFIKDGCPSYRFYYEHPEGRITIFSSEYETSYTGVSYIIDRKEVE